MIQIFSPTIRRKEMDSVLTCMVDEKIGPGEVNVRFVAEIKNFSHSEGALVFRSPAIALSRALKSLLLPPSSNVAISSLAPIWQKIALEESGFSPILADVDENTACLTAENAAKCVESGAQAIIVSEPFGQIPEDIEEIVSLGVPVIEDISESAGGSFLEKQAGSFGKIAVWGLEETDIVTAGGGAALCFPQKNDWESFAPIFRKTKSFDILPDLNCALGFAALKEWRKNEEIRKSIASVFRSSVLQARRHRIFSRPSDSALSVCSFPIVVADGVKEVMQFLDRKEIGAKMAFADSAVSEKIENGENTEDIKTAFSRTIQVPLYPRLKPQQIESISKVLAALP